MTRPAAVIFDCDGVLVDSEAVALDMLGRDLADAGLPMSHAEMERLFVGGTIAGVGAKAGEMGARLPVDWVPDFYRRLYAALAKGTPMIAGAEGVLAALDQAGIPYGVGSNGSQEKMRITLGQHPQVMARLQGRLFSGPELGMLKPEPGLYLAVAAALGAEPAQCFVIEDSVTGCIAARRAGMRCMGYAPHGDGAMLAAEGALVFHAMAHLPALLGLGQVG